jgi:hypothetical protein
MQDQSDTRPLPTLRTTQTQNKDAQTSMPRRGFETMVSVFERANTIYSLNRSATLAGDSAVRPHTRNYYARKSLCDVCLFVCKTNITLFSVICKITIRYQ